MKIVALFLAVGIAATAQIVPIYDPFNQELTVSKGGSGSSGITAGVTTMTGFGPGAYVYNNAGVAGSGTLGTGVATWLGSPGGANFFSALVPASGTCSSSTFLRGDGACAAAGGGITIGTTPVTGGTAKGLLYYKAGVVGDTQGDSLLGIGFYPATAFPALWLAQSSPSSSNYLVANVSNTIYWNTPSGGIHSFVQGDGSVIFGTTAGGAFQINGSSFLFNGKTCTIVSTVVTCT